MSPEFLYPFHNCPPQSPMPIHINRFRIIKSNLFNTYIIVILKFISDLPYRYVVACLYGFSLFIQRRSNWAKSRYHICQFVKGKVNCTLVQAVRPKGGVEVQLYPFLTTALEGVRSQRHAPAALYPGKSRYPLYRRLCVCQLAGWINGWQFAGISGWLNA